MNAAKPFLDVFSANRNRTAIVESNGQSITYDELIRQILGLAELFKKGGLSPGDLVLLQVPNGIVFAVTSLAVLRAGGVVLLVEPGVGDEIYLSRVNLASPKWIVVEPRIIRINKIPGARSFLKIFEIAVPPIPKLKEGMQKIVISKNLLDKLAKNNVDLHDEGQTERGAKEDAIVVFTGGTTSLPKGVRLSTDAFLQYFSHVSSIIEEIQIETFLADTPPQVLYALLHGFTIYITKGLKGKRARYVLELIRRGVINAYFGSPFIWIEMMELEGATREKLPDTLKAVLLGSAPVTSDFLSLLLGWLEKDTRTVIIYGMTEVGPICTVNAESKFSFKGEGDLVGEPIENVHVEIKNNGLESGISEIIVHSPSLYSGYLGQPERSKDQGLNTGDLGRFVTVDGKKMLVLMGRSKDMIIRKGINIYPLSFEAGIKRLVDRKNRYMLRECALIGLWNSRKQDEEVILCVQSYKGQKIDMDLLKKHTEKICGTSARPDHYFVVDPFPIVGRQNKIDKKALKQHCAKILGRDYRKNPDLK